VDAKRLAVVIPFSTHQFDELLHRIRHQWKGSPGKHNLNDRGGSTTRESANYVPACQEVHGYGQYIDLVFFLSSSFVGVPEMQEEITLAVHGNRALYGCYNQVLFLSARGEGALTYSEEEDEERERAAAHQVRMHGAAAAAAAGVHDTMGVRKRGGHKHSRTANSRATSGLTPAIPWQAGRSGASTASAAATATSIAADTLAQQLHSSQQRQFYKLFHTPALLEHYDYFFWMTVEVTPIREHWIDVVYRQVLASHYHYFWVKGSPVLPNCLPHSNIQNSFTLSAGPTSLLDVLDSTLNDVADHHAAELQLHKPDCDFHAVRGLNRRIDSCALYRLGDKEFNEFIERARRSAISRSLGSPDVPAITQQQQGEQEAGGQSGEKELASTALSFDSVLFQFLHDDSNLHLLTRLSSRFQYSEFIQAIHRGSSLATTSPHSLRQSEDKLARLTADDFSPQTFLVHLTGESDSGVGGSVARLASSSTQSQGERTASAA
jgi:hypothetical protein